MLYLHLLYMILRLLTPSKIMCNFIEMMSLNMSNFAAGSSLLIQIQIAIVGIIIVLGIFFIWRAVSRIDQRLKIVEINQKTLAQCQNMASLNLGSGDPSVLGGAGSCPIKPSSGVGSGVGSGTYPQMKKTSSTVPAGFRDIDEFSDEMLKVFGDDDELDDEDDDVYDEYEEDSEYISTTTTANIVITPIEIIASSCVPVMSAPSVSKVIITPVDDETLVVTPTPRPSTNASPSPSTTVLSGTHVETRGESRGESRGETRTSLSLNLEEDAVVDTESESGNPLSKSKLSGMNLEKLKSICTNHNLSTDGTKKVLIARILGESRD